MKESTMKYARRAWTELYEDDEYDNLLLELYQKCRLPKKEGQKRHEWQCQFCCKFFKCVLRLNFHRIRGCPVTGMLKMYPVVHKDQQDAADYTLRQKGFMNFKEQPAFEHSRPKKQPRQMIEKTLKTTVHNDDFLQHTTMLESTASPPGPSKGGMEQIGCVPDMNRHTTQGQHTIDCMQTEEEKTPIPQKYAGHEGLKMKMQELLNDGHNVLNTKVIFFKHTPVEIPLGMPALTPLTTEHGMVNDELMDWYFAYYHTYGPQNAFEVCVIANSFMWQHLNSHVSEHGSTENSLKAFVKRRLAKRPTQSNTLIVPICDSLHWSLMILERGKYYHMNPKPDYEPHSNNLQMRILFAKCWEIMQGNYNGNEVDDSILDKWLQPNVPTQTGSWECGWFVLKYFDMYIQQRFVEFELVQFTEAWFAYDDAIAMRTWLEEAIRTELFGPTFENSGPWQLMKSSRGGWIAPQVSRHVSEESEQSLALMYDNPPRIRGSPDSRQSNSATEHMDIHKGVQEGTITPNTDGSPARSKNNWQSGIRRLKDHLSLTASNSTTKHMDTHKGLLPRDFSSLSASNSATVHMDTHKGVQEGTITPNTDGSPARSKMEKQLEMEGHRDFIQECAIEDEEWKWSPVYLLLRDFFSLSAYLPRPWKHTAEEWHLIQKFMKAKFYRFNDFYNTSSIVVALQSTWKLHFSEHITDVDLNTLSQRLEHVSQEKEFVSNLLQVQNLMWGQCDDMESNDLQILASDIAFFIGPSETPGHQIVMKRVCNNLSDIAAHAMVMPPYDPENFKDMWIRGCPKNKQEMLIKKWKRRLLDSYLYFYEVDTVNLS